MPKFDLTDKQAVITGAGSGIGRSIAQTFARQGAHVHILDLDEKGANQTIKEIRENGNTGDFYPCNVANQVEVQNALDKIYQMQGKVDILVNNAGIASIGKLEDITQEEFEKVFQVNVKGVYNCMLAAIQIMKKVSGGVILNMDSVASHMGIPDRFAYTMSKGAVQGMTISVARDYIHEGIRCNAIAPARVHTPFVDGFIQKNYPGQEKEMFEKLSQSQPIGRMAKPEEIADLALYLCADESSFITGNNYPIDGGFIHIKM